MKTTFLIGPPRCGSLALSIIMNNQKCLAHHEGLDFSQDIYVYSNTASGKLRRTAQDYNKNYFCCDISLSRNIIKSFLEYSAADFQVLFITMNPKFTAHSLDSLTCGKYHKAMKETVEKINRDNLELFAKATASQQCSKFLSIHKEISFFDEVQIKLIADFVGARPSSVIEDDQMEYLSQVHYSINSYHLSKGLKQLGIIGE